MKHKLGVNFFVIAIVLSLFFIPDANATMINLIPANSSVSVGDMFDINIMADIDPGDAIIAFGFDLDLSGTGSLAFMGFTPNSPTFAVDPFHESLSDTDGILGASGGDFLFGPAVFGNNILLGALSFEATDIGDVQVGLSADDLDFFFTEGLIPEDIALTNFMPQVVAANVTISQPTAVPEPTTFLLFGIGLGGIGLMRKKVEM